MPSPYHHDHPSIIVNGVCSSVYARALFLLYCDRGEAGPHHYHEAQTTSDVASSWRWSDDNPDALNDPRVMERLPK